MKHRLVGIAGRYINTLKEGSRSGPVCQRQTSLPGFLFPGVAGTILVSCFASDRGGKGCAEVPIGIRTGSNMTTGSAKNCTREDIG